MEKHCFPGHFMFVQGPCPRPWTSFSCVHPFRVPSCHSLKDRPPRWVVPASGGGAPGQPAVCYAALHGGPGSRPSPPGLTSQPDLGGSREKAKTKPPIQTSNHFQPLFRFHVVLSEFSRLNLPPLSLSQRCADIGRDQSAGSDCAWPGLQGTILSFTGLYSGNWS